MRRYWISKSVDASVVALGIASLLFADASSTNPGMPHAAQPRIAPTRVELSQPRRAPRFAQNATQAPPATKAQIRVAAASAAVSVMLTPAASPSTGQPGVTVINLTGNGFPAGTISPSQITVQLTPVSGGAAVSASATAVTSIV